MTPKANQNASLALLTSTTLSKTIVMVVSNMPNIIAFGLTGLIFEQTILTDFLIAFDVCFRSPLSLPLIALDNTKTSNTPMVLAVTNTANAIAIPKTPHGVWVAKISYASSRGLGVGVGVNLLS